MKFATAALIGAVSASNFKLPEVDYDQASINQAIRDLNEWGDSFTKAVDYDTEQTMKSFIHAYSTYKTEEFANFGQAWKPFAQWQVEFFDALTVDGKCNTAAATECVNSWILAGATKRGYDTTMIQCVSSAGCRTNWQDLTQAEKQALATKFKTSVETIGKAYKKMEDKAAADLKVGIAAHEARVKKMHKDFDAAIFKVANDLGCDQKIFQNCFQYYDKWVGFPPS